MPSNIATKTNAGSDMSNPTRSRRRFSGDRRGRAGRGWSPAARVVLLMADNVMRVEIPPWMAHGRTAAGGQNP